MQIVLKSAVSQMSVWGWHVFTDYQVQNTFNLAREELIYNL